jgi:GntR family transcriptional regulator, rspAB operon transcriptional repressor
MVDLNQKEIAYKIIKEMIVDGDLQMGQNISDKLLSNKLKLGLTPIRDALNLLKSEDLIISYPKKGTFVFELSSKLFFDIFESRRIFETYGLKTSNKLNHDLLLTTEEEILNKMSVSIKEKDYFSYAKLDSEFHESFILGTGNDVFIKLYRNLEPKIATIRNAINYNLSEFNTKESFKMHKKIINNIKTGNIDKSINLLDDHIFMWYDRVFKITSNLKLDLKTFKNRLSTYRL